MEKTDRSMIFFSSYQVNALLFCTLLLPANSNSMISEQAPWQRQNRRDEVLLRFQLKTLSMPISQRYFQMGIQNVFHLIGTHSKGNYFLGVWIWYLYSILKARWSILRVTDEYKQYMISGSKKAPQIGRVRSRANSLTWLFDSIVWPDVFVFSMISYDQHKNCANSWGELEARTRIIFISAKEKLPVVYP